MNGDYYVAVPLDAPPQDEPGSSAKNCASKLNFSPICSRASKEKKSSSGHCCRPPAASRSGSGVKVRNLRALNCFAFTSSHNGAWSDIILGAVMGAARRAEAGEEEVRSSRGPDLPRPAAHVLPDAPARQSETPAPNFESASASPAAKLSIDPQHAMRFGPYAETYRPDPTPPPTHMAARTRRPPASASPEADATSNAANSNTARTAPIVPPPSRSTATVVAMPRAQHYAQANNETSQPARDPALARVTLQRETATFTVPVSEAAIPDFSKWPSQRLIKTGQTLSSAGRKRDVISRARSGRSAGAP